MTSVKSIVCDRTNKFEERSRLETCIPLATPYVVMVDPSSACNLKCLFCPTGDSKLIRSTGRFQGCMKPELFDKIIRDLDSFNSPIKTLRLYKEGEPLLNPYFPDLVSCARKSNKIGRIDTTTNGLLLTHDLSRKIIDAGIDQINISINSVSSERFKFLTKQTIDFDRLVEEIAFLHSISGQCEIYVKAIAENLTDIEKSEFFMTFSGISDRIFLEHLQPNWPNYNFDYIDIDYSVGHYGQPLEDRDVCPYIFYLIVINSDGSVSACVQDWEHRLIIGDTKTQSVKEIWDGESLRKLQLTHLSGRRSNIDVCAVCPVLKHGALDNIDSAAEMLLEKLTGGC